MSDYLESGLLPLTKISRLPRNPKDHHVQVIVESYGRFGFVDRMIVNRETGHLLSGHGRVKALLQLKATGHDAPDGIEVNDDEWLVPVDYISVCESEEEALAIALNRTVELGGWDDAKLAEVLADLVATPEGLAGVGYDGDDLDALLAGLANPIGWDGAEGDQSGSSPWDRVKEAHEGEMFQFGAIHCRIDRLTYDLFVAMCPPSNISEFVENMINAYCNR